MMQQRTKRHYNYFFLLLVLFSQASPALPIIQIEILNHLFYPSDIEIAPNTKVKLIIINLDSSAEEFESYELNREKVIPANSRGTLFIGPLAPGEYPFFGEFFPKTAQGVIRVREQ